MFLVSAILVVPALLSFFLIGRGRVEGTAGNQPPMVGDGQENARTTWQGVQSLFLDRRLVIFAACVVLFFAASAAIGPGVAAQVTRRQPDIAALVVAAIILLPQAIVASISPWIGRTAEISGPRPLLVVGWGLLPLQGFLVRSAAWSLCVGGVQPIECRQRRHIRGNDDGRRRRPHPTHRWLQSRAGCTRRGGFRWRVVEHLVHRHLRGRVRCPCGFTKADWPDWSVPGESG